MKLFILLATAMSFSAICFGILPTVDFNDELKDAKCFVDTYTYLVMRIYNGSSGVDTNFLKSVKNLKTFQWRAMIRAYIVPCPSCDAAKQAAEIGATINGSGYWTMRSAVSVMGKEWSNNKAKNVVFLRKLLEELTKQTVWTPAIVTNEREWSRIMGSSVTEFSRENGLWYVKHDGIAERKGFKAFGGWTRPIGKQYGSGTVCGLKVNLDSIFDD